jgi:hypothetical protein
MNDEREIMNKIKKWKQNGNEKQKKTRKNGKRIGEREDLDWDRGDGEEKRTVSGSRPLLRATTGPQPGWPP